MIKSHTIEWDFFSCYTFRNLQFLAEFENLTSLNLDHNNIDDHTVFPHMPKLQLLWLNHNNIEELYPFIKNLYESLPNLRYLCLMGNKAAPSYLNGGTFYDYLQYRYEHKKQLEIHNCFNNNINNNHIRWIHADYIYFTVINIFIKKRLYVISWFPHLVHLDDRAVTPEQRQEAKRLFKRPLLENLTENAPLPECIKHLHNKIANIFSKPTLPYKLKPRGTNFVV